jgi:hypothetical protein
LEIRDTPQNRAAPDLAKGYGSASPASLADEKCQPFSNDRLNFKHSFWAAQGPEKGIFAAFRGSLPQINWYAAAAIQRRPNG